MQKRHHELRRAEGDVHARGGPGERHRKEYIYGVVRTYPPRAYGMIQVGFDRPQAS